MKIMVCIYVCGATGLGRAWKLTLVVPMFPYLKGKEVREEGKIVTRTTVRVKRRHDAEKAVITN